MAAESVSTGFNGEEEGIAEGESVDAAVEVAMVGDGLVEEADFVIDELLDPESEDEEAGEAGSFEGVFDGGGEGFHDRPDAGLPGGMEGEFAGVEVGFTGVLAGALLAFRGRWTFGETGVSAVGGELLFRNADE